MTVLGLFVFLWPFWPLPRWDHTDLSPSQSCLQCWKEYITHSRYSNNNCMVNKWRCYNVTLIAISWLLYFQLIPSHNSFSGCSGYSVLFDYFVFPCVRQDAPLWPSHLLLYYMSKPLTALLVVSLGLCCFYKYIWGDEFSIQERLMFFYPFNYFVLFSNISSRFVSPFFPELIFVAVGNGNLIFSILWGPHPVKYTKKVSSCWKSLCVSELIPRTVLSIAT